MTVEENLLICLASLFNDLDSSSVNLYGLRNDGVRATTGLKGPLFIRIKYKVNQCVKEPAKLNT